MKPILLKPVLLIVFMSCISLVAFTQTQKYHRIQVAVSNEKFKTLMESGLDIDHYEYKNNILVAEVSDADIRILNDNNVTIKYIIKDIAKNLSAYNAAIDAQAKNNTASPGLAAVTVNTPVNFGSGGSYGTAGAVARHFTFQEMQNELDDMKALYPNLITIKSSIGTTDEGRQIFMVKISDNADVDENEPEVFLNAVHHAREPIGMTQLLFFMWHVLENYSSDKEIKTLINSSEIYIIPCVNPDGYVYNAATNSTGGGMWRKNRHVNGDGTLGVDNNRNYGFNWGGTGSSTVTSSETYRGANPFSEKENIAVRNFVNSRQFVTEFNYHSYGNYCIYPYSYTAVNNNPEIPLFTQLSTFLTEDNGFTIGNAQATVNYVASGVAEDWAYGEQTTKGKMYGFTPEVGNSTDGFYPAASRIIPLCNTMIVMNKNLLKLSTKYGLVTATPPAGISSFSGAVPFSIKNFSIYPATYTVGLTPLSAFVTSIDPAIVINSNTLFQIQNNAFNFTIDANTPAGTNLDFVLSTDNGYHTRLDTITIQYNCAAPTGTTTTNITTNSATVNWAAISGITDYNLSTKSAAVATWDADVLVTGTTSNLTALVTNTAYNWRVKTVNCLNYSATQIFTTLGVCGTPAPVSSAITTSGFTLTWPAINGATSYDVQTRLQGTTVWTTSNVTTTSKVITGLNSNSVYEYQVRANCPSGTSAYSTTQTVTTLVVTVVYCASNGNNTTYEWIDLVLLGTINRPSGKEAGGYSNTGLSTTLARGTTYTITYSAGFASTIYKENWKVFIDYNGDGDFVDAGETVVSSTVTGAGNFTASFTVPATASLTNTRMRVKMNYGTFTNPCGAFTYGEVEDYNITIASIAKTTNAEITLAATNQTVEVAMKNKVTNPFKDYINIVLDANYKNNTILTLVNSTGVTVYKKVLTYGTTNYKINTTHLPAGVYALTIENGGNKKTIKLVK